MDLRQSLRILRARKWLLAASVVAALGVATMLALLPAREWAASATLQIQPASALTGGAVRPDDVSYVDRLINTYSAIVASADFGDSVARRAALSTRPALAVDAPSNTNLIAIEATTSSAAAAARAANAAVDELIARVQQRNRADLGSADAAFRERVTQIQNEIAKAHIRLSALRAQPQNERVREMEVALQEQITSQRGSLSALRNDHEAQRSSQAARAGVVSPAGRATPPSAPVSRRLGLVLPLGLIFGLLAGGGLALAAENFARRFRSEGEIEQALDTPVLATIPRGRRTRSHVLFKPGSREHEAIRRVRTQLLLADRAFKRLLVVSAEPGEGKSTIAANLARSASESGRSVILVDADLRRPTAHKFFGESNDGGLSDLLSGGESGWTRWQEFALTDSAGVSILPAGPPVDDPATLLGSEAMSHLLNMLSLRFDIVIVDSPALLAVSDTLALVALVDAVILVAGSNIAPDALRLANRQLRRAHAHPLGLVINGSDDANLSLYLDYEYTPS